MIYSNFTGRVAKKAKVIQFYESAIFILLSWTALHSLYFAGEETKSVEKEHTIQELQKLHEKFGSLGNLSYLCKR